MRDEFDDDPPPRRKAGPLDSLFADTNIVMLLLFAVCCGQIALIMSAVCLFTATDPVAKSKATTTLVVSLVMSGAATVLVVSLNFLDVFLK